ncbi:hypothetical protein T07_4397 [Trichinella nelsoni]|uniref:Uncharacterized protein n=1 Tax=Trichinella nelsoni TaxID=6336 RepID=A0A0V0RCS9_9BILA|nr:hypothetical protein T07_4397 [Trichinella nelsoni]
MSYANSVDLTLYKFEEFHFRGYLVFQCVEQQSRRAFCSSLQYYLHLSAVPVPILMYSLIEFPSKSSLKW